MCLYIVNDRVNGGECHRNAGVGTAIVDGDAACVLVAEGSAGEGNVLNVAYALIDLCGLSRYSAQRYLTFQGSSRSSMQAEKLYTKPLQLSRTP